MTPEFYKRFQNFSHILIYQTDAWVFSDQLEFWCKSGYDYLGAPDSFNYHKTNILNKLFGRQTLNGGLSLRNIKKCILVTKFFHALGKLSYRGNEDSLFSAAYPRFFLFRLFLKLPDYQTALKFAFEKKPSVEFEINKNQLPFACHAFRRYEPEFWEKHGIKTKE